MSNSANGKKTRRRTHLGAATLARGEPMVWLTGSALVLALAMIGLLLAWILVCGMATFWPKAVTLVELHDGTKLLGEVAQVDDYPITADDVLGKPDAIRDSFFDELLATIGDWKELESAIQSETDELRVRLSQNKFELARAQQQFDLTKSSLESNPESVYGRRDSVVNDSKVEAYGELLAKVEDWQSRLDGVQLEIDSTTAAIDYFRDLEADRSIAEAIVEAPYDIQLVALRGLLRLDETQSGRPFTMRRRKLRTGNKQLTGTPFNWVSDYEIASESTPENAWLIEREEWGPFYGTAQQFTILHRRAVSQKEQQLVAAYDLMQSYRDRGAESGRDNLDQTISRLKSDIDALRADSTQQLLAGIQRRDGDSLIAIDADGNEFDVDQLPADSHIAEFKLTVDGADLTWQLYQENHSPTRRLFDQRDRLQDYDLGNWSRLSKQAHLRVRQAEIDDNNERLLELAQDLEDAHRALWKLEQAASNADQTITAVSERYSSDEALVAVAQSARDANAVVLDESRLETQSRIDQLENQLAELPTRSQRAVEYYVTNRQRSAAATVEIKAEIEALTEQISRCHLHMLAVDSQQATIAVGDVVRAYRPNLLSNAQRWEVYRSRWFEFLVDQPREANSEGGVFPSIWGTVVMTLIMSLAVVPFGVLAALYLREYAKPGPIVSAVRIAINNLAGVPSIVFGVFGLGFFCYRIGAYIDGGPVKAGFEPWSNSRWMMYLGGLAITSVGAFTLGMLSLTGNQTQRSIGKRWLSKLSVCTWLVSIFLFILLLVHTPFFNGFFQAKLPDPTWGKGGVFWAALTLALLTLPVVIVATEESLAAVPNSMREGSYGCGASKWQTIRRIVLPHALPGIMTGMILAMARGAGEVAPLMLVGVAAVAPDLPVDHVFPFLHGERSFMHLGFHIFDLGFQSPDADAAQPMVYTTTLLLIGIITILNVSAVWLRTLLRRRFRAGQF